MSIEADAAVRRRLVTIADELGDLARDDFVAKHRLNLEADELRLLLMQSSEKDDELLKSWASTDEYDAMIGMSQNSAVRS